MKIVEFIPSLGAQFHFGEILPNGENQNMETVSPFPSSDLLFSAFMNIWQKIYGDATELSFFFKEDKIRISSAFFYLKFKEKTIRFLPKPVVADLYKCDNHKALKKITFVSETIINNGILPEQWFNESVCKIVDGKFLCLKSELSDKDISIYKEMTVPKVKVHTTDDENRLYSQTNIMFSYHLDGESGYYFYLKENLSDGERQKLYTVINLLGDEGLGGDRSSGCGLFNQIRISEKEDFASSSNYYLSLSLGNPENEEHAAVEYYRLTTKGGRKINGEQRLKLVNMIKEGAILSQPATGRIVDVSPNADGSYLKNGKIFLIPLHLNFEKLWKPNQNN